MKQSCETCKPGFMAPRGAIERKPPHGAPCNSCGMCCVAVLCPLAQHLLGYEHGPCPFLVWDSEDVATRKSSCGLVVAPMRYAWPFAAMHGIQETSDAASLLIGSGFGCDARFNGETPNTSFYETLRKWDRDNAAPMRRAKKLWGIIR